MIAASFPLIGIFINGNIRFSELSTYCLGFSALALSYLCGRVERRLYRTALLSKPYRWGMLGLSIGLLALHVSLFSCHLCCLSKSKNLKEKKEEACIQKKEE